MNNTYPRPRSADAMRRLNRQMLNRNLLLSGLVVVLVTVLMVAAHTLDSAWFALFALLCSTATMISGWAVVWHLGRCHLLAELQETVEWIEESRQQLVVVRDRLAEEGVSLDAPRG